MKNSIRLESIGGHNMVDVLKLVNWMRVKNNADLQTDNPNVEELTQMKAMKLLYYMQAASLVIRNKSLFSNDILAWEYGPVVVEVHKKYAGQRSIVGDIDKTAENDFELIEHDKEIARLISWVYSRYGKRSTYDLMRLTHREGPWQQTDINHVISPEKIKKYYSKEKTFADYSNTDNLFAKHSEIDLKKEINSLNIGDNGKLVGKEDVWRTN